MSIPTNQDFATEVRTERLKMLCQVTLAISGVLLWILISLGLLSVERNVLWWVISVAPVALGSLIAYLILRSNRFQAAVWVFTVAVVSGVALALGSGDPQTLQIAPFAFPLLIFVAGLLMPTRSTFLLAFATALITVFVPLAVTGDWAFWGIHQIAALVLIVLSTLLAAQVTGELYRVTEWALQNYRRERQITQELFDNREMLEISLKRSQSLSERLQEANAALEEARKIAEDARDFRGKFLANMSHELRTPLNAIIGFSETMLKFPAMYDDIELPEAYRDDLGQVFKSGRHLLTIINDILDLSKVDAGKLEIQLSKLELDPIFDQVLSTAEGLIGDRPIELKTQLPDTLPLVLADANRLQQVLLNLYSNASKFTVQGSITLALHEEDEHVRISVTDTGSGIAEKDLEVIFEEFKQAGSSNRRDPRSGAGLGLAISRQLVTPMGGRIWAESQPGKGSAFHVLLRRYQPEQVTKTTA